MRVWLLPQLHVLPADVRPWVPTALRRQWHGSACRMFLTRIPISPAGGPSPPHVTEVLARLTCMCYAHSLNSFRSAAGSGPESHVYFNTNTCCPFRRRCCAQPPLALDNLASFCHPSPQPTMLDAAALSSPHTLRAGVASTNLDDLFSAAQKRYLQTSAVSSVWIVLCAVSGRPLQMGVPRKPSVVSANKTQCAADDRCERMWLQHFKRVRDTSACLNLVSCSVPCTRVATHLAVLQRRRDRLHRKHQSPQQLSGRLQAQ